MKQVLSSLAIAAALCFTAQNASATAVEDAQGLIKQGQFDAALRLLDGQLKDAPQDADARFLRGLVLTRLGRSGEAVKVFADITRDYPQLPEPYNNLAVLYAQQGDYEKARDALEAALSTHPSYATAHENLGDIYAALAGSAYGRALQLDKNNQEVRNKLSFINRLNSKDTSVATPAPTPVAPAPSADEDESPRAAPPATAVAAPEEPAIAPPPAAKPRLPEDVDPTTTAAVSDTLSAWAKSWSTKDVDGYLAFYSAEFRPEGGVQRSTWEAQRRDRIKRPARIKVAVINPQVTTLGDGVVRVFFRQEYESDSFSDQVSKVIELRDENGWKVVREYTR